MRCSLYNLVNISLNLRFLNGIRQILKEYCSEFNVSDSFDKKSGFTQVACLVVLGPSFPRIGRLLILIQVEYWLWHFTASTRSYAFLRSLEACHPVVALGQNWQIQHLPWTLWHAFSSWAPDRMTFQNSEISIANYYQLVENSHSIHPFYLYKLFLDISNKFF